MSVMSKVKGLMQRFAANQKGNVAIMFGITIVPMMVAAGVAIDLGRFVADQTAVQTALDSAALAAATSKTTDALRLDAANKLFAANLTSGDIDTASVTHDFTIAGGKVVGKASLDVPTMFMQVSGITSLHLDTDTQVTIPVDKSVEIALVLDYSGSMQDSIAGGVKYIAMRNAAKKLIQDLQAANPSKVKFALVPFSHHVYTTLPMQFVLGQTGTGNWTGCTQDRPYPANLTDDAPGANDNTKWGQPQAPDHLAYGCSGYVSHNLKIAPLTNDFTALKNQLDAMTPYAYTHIALGVEFGFHVLSNGSPYTEGVPYSDTNTRKVMIVLTDGAQTEPAFGPGSARNVSQGEKNLEKLCANVKAKDITVMTIAYDLDDNATQARLRNCATDPAKNFFVATDTSAVANAFADITKQVSAQAFLSR